MWHTVLPLSHTNLAQFGLVIGNVLLIGGHDDPARESLLAKSLCTHQGSHTYKRCSSQPSDSHCGGGGAGQSSPERRVAAPSVCGGGRAQILSLTSPQQQHRVLVEEAPPACVLHPQAAFQVLQQNAKCSSHTQPKAQPVLSDSR